MISRHKIQKKDLASYEVLLDDPLITERFFGVQVNDYFTVGTWSILIGPDVRPIYYLKPNTPILIELIDLYGNPIWIDFPVTSPAVKSINSDGTVTLDFDEKTNPNAYGYYSTAQNKQKLLATVNIFKDIPTGDATLTLLGVADITILKEFSRLYNIPTDEIELWDGYYNVKYKKTIRITNDNRLKNTSPLIFKQRPNASIQEINQYYYEDYLVSPIITVSQSQAQWEREEIPIPRLEPPPRIQLNPDPDRSPNDGAVPSAGLVGVSSGNENTSTEQQSSGNPREETNITFAAGPLSR